MRGRWRGSTAMGWWMIAGTLTISIASPAAAQGSEAPPLVGVDCLLLDGEKREELAARLIGEFLVSNLDGTLELTCSSQTMAGTLHTTAGIFEAERTPSTNTSIFEGLHDLGLELIERASQADFDEPRGDNPENEETSSDDVVSSPTPEPAERTQARHPENSQRTHRATHLGVSGSLGMQVWGRELFGALGPEIQAELMVETLFGVATRVIPYFSLGNREGYSIRDTRWSLDVVAQPWGWLRVGAGPTLSIARAHGPSTADAGRDHSVRPIVNAYTELLVPWGDVTGFFRAGAAWSPVERVIERNGERLLAVPRVQALFNLGLRTGGSR